MGYASNGEGVKLYDWRGFFREVAGKLCEIGKDESSRNAKIIERAQEVFGEDHPIVNSEYLDKGGVDPFSFIYSLSQPPAPHVDKSVYLENAKDAFGFDSKVFPFTNFEYPHAIPMNSLFHAGGSYVADEKANPPREKTDTNLNEIWDLFSRIYDAEKYDNIDDESFQTALDRPGFGLANLTHVMFLINPDVFLPIDDRTLWLPLGKEWSEMDQTKVCNKIKDGTYTFNAIMASFMKAFPGCKPYEINLLAYLLKVEDLCLPSNLTWKISSDRYDDGSDYWYEDFRPNSWVHVGEKSSSGKTTYPRVGPKKGDYMVVRMGGLVHGLGVVLQNYYAEGNNTDDDYINVVWVHLEDKREIAPRGNALSRHHKGIGFYSRTEELLQVIRKKQGEIRDMKKEVEQQYSEYISLLEANKNLILTGAPGTGKTYIAKELAAYFVGVAKESLKTEQKYAFVQFHPSYDYTDFVEGLRPIKGKEKNEIGFELRDGTFKAFCKHAMDDPSDHVFIIDEINRGEISKIFGELFFSIDPGYRGDAGAVRTQYANMHEQAAEDFYVPDNVYIIGTMNDIDRSVESFDFAMRRRFAWKEVKYTDNLEMLTNLDDDRGEAEKDRQEAERRLRQLNEAICPIKSGTESDGKSDTGIEGLNAAYHIGPAYFLKVKEYSGVDRWKNLWDYHIEPLLREYLRTLSDPEGKLDTLKQAYNKT